MNFWWKFGVLIGSYALVALGAWHTHTWYDGAAQAKYNQAIIDKQQEIAKMSDQISAAYEAGKQAASVSKSSSTLKLNNHNANYSSCHVLPDDRRLLQSTVVNANATR